MSRISKRQSSELKKLFHQAVPGALSSNVVFSEALSILNLEPPDPFPGLTGERWLYDPLGINPRSVMAVVNDLAHLGPQHIASFPTREDARLAACAREMMRMLYDIYQSELLTPESLVGQLLIKAGVDMEAEPS